MLRFILILSFISIQLFAQTTYYVSSSQGNDANNGISQASPWKTLNKVSNANLNPGDKVLFKRGDIWNNEQLIIVRSGNANNLITFDAFGTGSKPGLSGNNTLTKVVVIAANIHHLIIKDIEFKNIDPSSAYSALVLLDQLANNITIDNCKFSQSMKNISQWVGMIYGRDNHHLTVQNSEFTGGIAGINLTANYQDSHNDVHHILIDNNWFHKINTRINENDPLSGGSRSNGIWLQQWFGTGGPDSSGLPGNTLGQEGTYRDFIIKNNNFDSVAFGGIYWYRDRHFYSGWSLNGVPQPERQGYNWYIGYNNFNLSEGAAVELAPLSNRWGQNHPDTGVPIEWSIIEHNTIDSMGYNYITKLPTQTASGVGGGIESHGWKQVYVQSNYITYCSSVMGDGHGFNFDFSPSFSKDIPCDSVVVRRNLIGYCNDNWGNDPTHINDNSGIQFATGREDNEVYDNVIYECSYGIRVHPWSLGQPGKFTGVNNKIFNNTIFKGRIGIQTSSGDTYQLELNSTWQVRNNIVTYCTEYGWRNTPSVTMSAIRSNNLWFGNVQNFSNVNQGINDKFGNPMFADTLNKNFQLLNGSAAIDQGIMVTLNVPTVGLRILDILGNIVPFNLLPDIGAYEYGSTSGGNFINVNTRILIEGSFSNGSMATTLLNNEQLPLSQPYNQSPWNYNGNEVVSSIPAGIVDWVLLELRTGTTASSLVSRKAAFIKSNGFVVNLDGVNPVSFNEVPAGNYYIVVRHRNHLSVMSSNAIPLSSNSTLYDFTTGLDKAFGTNPMANLGNGKWGMFAGDGDINGLINVIDYGTVGNHLFETGYNFGDLDLNGIINVMDYAKTNLNLFRNSQVPN